MNRFNDSLCSVLVEKQYLCKKNMLYTLVYMESCIDDMWREHVRKRYPLERNGESIQRKKKQIDRGSHPVQEKHDCRWSYPRFNILVSNT
jgi:hypothetical protein